MVSGLKNTIDDVRAQELVCRLILKYVDCFLSELYVSFVQRSEQ